MKKYSKYSQDIRWIGMAKRLLEQPKRGHWNIECGNTEYFHWFVRKHPIGCRFSGWTEN